MIRGEAPTTAIPLSRPVPTLRRTFKRGSATPHSTKPKARIPHPRGHLPIRQSGRCPLHPSPAKASAVPDPADGHMPGRPAHEPASLRIRPDQAQMARGTDQPLSAFGPPTARPGRAPHPYAVLLPRHGMLPVQGAVRHIPDSRKWTQIVPQHGLPNPRGPSSDAATDPPPRVSLFRPGPTQRGTLKWASAVRHLTRTKARSPCLPRPSPDPVGWAVPAPPLSGESVCWPSPRQTVTCRPDRRMNRHPSGSDQTIGLSRSMAFPTPAVLPPTRRRDRRPASLSSDPPRHCGGPSRGLAHHVTPPCPPTPFLGPAVSVMPSPPLLPQRPLSQTPADGHPPPGAGRASPSEAYSVRRRGSPLPADPAPPPRDGAAAERRPDLHPPGLGPDRAERRAAWRSQPRGPSPDGQTRRRPHDTRTHRAAVPPCHRPNRSARLSGTDRAPVAQPRDPVLRPSRPACADGAHPPATHVPSACPALRPQRAWAQAHPSAPNRTRTCVPRNGRPTPAALTPTPRLSDPRSHRGPAPCPVSALAGRPAPGRHAQRTAPGAA